MVKLKLKFCLPAIARSLFFSARPPACQSPGSRHTRWALPIRSPGFLRQQRHTSSLFRGLPGKASRPPPPRAPLHCTCYPSGQSPTGVGCATIWGLSRVLHHDRNPPHSSAVSVLPILLQPHPTNQRQSLAASHKKHELSARAPPARRPGCPVYKTTRHLLS